MSSSVAGYFGTWNRRSLCCSSTSRLKIIDTNIRHSQGRPLLADHRGLWGKEKESNELVVWSANKTIPYFHFFTFMHNNLSKVKQTSSILCLLKEENRRWHDKMTSPSKFQWGHCAKTSRPLGTKINQLGSEKNSPSRNNSHRRLPLNSLR